MLNKQGIVGISFKNKILARERYEKLLIRLLNRKYNIAHIKGEIEAFYFCSLNSFCHTWQS